MSTQLVLNKYNTNYEALRSAKTETMFNGSFLRVCRILRFVKKIDFAFLSLGGPRHGARVWCLGRVPKHRNHWQEVEGSGKK